jgi:hypothetical protein
MLDGAGRKHRQFSEGGAILLWSTLRRLEDAMTVRMRVLLLVVFLSISLGATRAKKKPAVPAYVLKAHTVAVLIDPEAGTSLTDPMANKTAQDDVEKALLGSETGSRPAERSAVWRYESKDALHSPNVPAVAEFRKAIEETEKQQKSKP